MKYGDRLDLAIKIAKSSRRAVAGAVGVSEQAIGQVIRGETGALTAENSAKAADLLNVDHYWLATGDREPNPLGNDLVQVARDEVIIAQYNSGGAMGNGLQLDERPPGQIKSWHVDREWLRLNVPHYTSFNNLCIVTGFGPSMKPKYNPGDPLLCDRGVVTVESDGVFFFRIGNHGYIKQLQRIPTIGGLVLRAKSFNPDYDPFEIAEGMDFEVFGKILTVWRSEQF